MKKNIICLLSLLLFVFGMMENVSAKSVERTCTYNDGSNSIRIEIYDDTNVSCNAWILSFEGKGLNNKEDCQNWRGETKNTYISQKICPTYAGVYYPRGLGNAKVFVSYHKSEIDEFGSVNYHVLESVENSPQSIEDAKKEHCEDYEYSECVNKTDKQGVSCIKDVEQQKCKTKRACSYYTTEDTCPEESDYGRCKWIESENKCEKQNTLLCSDYVTKSQCPKIDEEGNACEWDAIDGCVEKESSDDSSGGSGSSSDPVDSGDNYDVTPQSVCVSPSYRRPMRFVGWILGVIRYLVPLVIIVLGAFDFYKSMASSDAEKGSKASIKSLVVRVGAGVFIFLLPGIIEFILGFVSTWNSGNPEYDYSRSWACCGECIFNSNCDVSGDTSSYCK